MKKTLSTIFKLAVLLLINVIPGSARSSTPPETGADIRRCLGREPNTTILDTTPSLGSTIVERAALKLNSPTDRAKLKQYRALRAFKKGKYAKAARLLNRALATHHDNTYVLDLLSVYEAMGRPKRAYNTFARMRSMDGTAHADRVRIAANRGMYAMQQGLPCEALGDFGYALTLMRRHGVDADSLAATLLNNQAVAQVFCQTNTRVDSNRNVHTRDLVRARNTLSRAVNLYDEDCPAQHNLDFLERLLEGIQWDSISGKPQYPRGKDIRAIDLPVAECVPPAPDVHEDIVRYLTREREVVFVLDVSGSMQAATPSGQSRFVAMQDLVTDLLGKLHPDIAVGLLTLGSDCDREPALAIPTSTDLSRAELGAIVRGLTPGGSTPLNQRLRLSAELFSGSRADDHAVFLCSDGLNSCAFPEYSPDESSCDVAAQLGRRGIKVHVFSLLLEGVDSESTYAIYDCMIKRTGGELLGLTEEGHEVKTARMDRPVYSLALTREDVLRGRYEGVEFDPAGAVDLAPQAPAENTDLR